MLEVDPVQIQQVIVNLVMNAMDAMAQYRLSELTIRSRHKNDDEGRYRSKIMGRASRNDICPRIFDPFFRPNLRRWHGAGYLP